MSLELNDSAGFVKVQTEVIEPPSRVPNFGHCLLLLLLAITILLVAQTVVIAAAGVFHSPGKLLVAVQNQRLQLIAMGIGYIATLLIARPLFTHLWNRPFAIGLAWNAAAAKRNGLRLLALGVILGIGIQAAESLVPMPKSLPMDDFFQNTSTVWALTAFGTLLAPLFEEIVFRGFLFPALAIAYDWLRLPRTAEAYTHWRSHQELSLPAVIVAAAVSSFAFALIHAAQLGWTWAAVGLLMVVSLVLTWVRVRARSVAASTVVHACYNLSVFVTLFLGTDGYRHLDRVAR
jgi:membrane protease YdiL (CAAX protease family)